MKEKVNYEQFIFAREYRGYSQTELASRIGGLSQSNLSKFEKGIGTLSNELINRIIVFLNFPSDFFKISFKLTSVNAHYRKKSTISKSERTELDHTIKLYSYIIDELSDNIEYPHFRFKHIDLEEGYTPTYIAKYTRKLLGLNYDPIIDINSLLEKCGVIIIPYNTDVEKFDGVSFYTEQGFPVMIINQNMSNDRKRLTIAHELGHLIMHVDDFLISHYRDVEKEAFEFAAEFLMPEDVIARQLYNLKLSELSSLKRFWHTSMASIILRAKELRCIDESRYKLFNIEMSRNGFRKREPIDVHIDAPTTLKQSFDLLRSTLGYSERDLSRAFKLPKDIINKYCTFNNQSNKLKILNINYL